MNWETSRSVLHSIICMYSAHDLLSFARGSAYYTANRHTHLSAMYCTGTIKLHTVPSAMRHAPCCSWRNLLGSYMTETHTNIAMVTRKVDD